MIFFTDKIKPYKLKNGIQVSPIPTKLKDGRFGYFLGEDWKNEITSKSIKTEVISKDNIVIADIDI